MKTLNKKANSVIAGLLKIGSHLHKRGDLIASEYDLNQQQFVVLNEIAKRKELIQKDIIGDLVLNKSHVSKILKKLKQLGYIKIVKSTNDKRTTVIQITDNGYAVRKKCLNDFNKWNNDWLKTLTEEQLDQIHQNINELTKLLEGENICTS